MKSISYSNRIVKPSDKLSLTSGAKVKPRKYTPPAPPEPILTIGKFVSLEMTLAEYEIVPNRESLRKIGGAK